MDQQDWRCVLVWNPCFDKDIQGIRLAGDFVGLGFVQGYCGLSGLRTPAGRWGRWSRMSSGGVLVDCRRRLCAAVAICTLELQCGDAMLTTGALEERTAVYRFGRVISHVLF